MHKDSFSPVEDSSEGVLLKGVSIYYAGSVLFIAGIALLALGTVLVMLFQIHYYSDPVQILQTVFCIGTGITLVLMGINLMIRQKKKGYYVIGFSTIISAVSILLFVLNYFDNWFYPVVGYVVVLYVFGFLGLLGNAFGNVTLWLIENRQPVIQGDFGEKKVKRAYTDEEILRDIEETTRRRIEEAAAELNFELYDSGNYRFGKFAPKDRGHVTRVKDDIGEAQALNFTMNPGETEKWGSIGVDKASSQLADAIMQQQEEKKGRFGGFWKRSRKKKEFDECEG
jgi:hypothetical protein